MSRDYEEFIAALNEHRVRYLIIGAHAVAFHARPRATKDLDILLDPAPANARRALAPVRIDLHSQVKGIRSFDLAWKNRVTAHFGFVPTHYLGLEDLVQAKEAVGRPQDRADVRVLRRAKTQPGVRDRSRGRRGNRRG